MFVQIFKMATAKLCCAFALLLYLQGNYAQQNANSNQNAGINNGIGLVQPAPARLNKPSNINQIPNVGLNNNLPQQSNLQQGNPLQAISANLQANLQQSSSLPSNLQSQGPAVTLTNLQIGKQGLPQLSAGIAANQPKIGTTQFNNPACRQNPQISQQNMAVNNFPVSPTQNMPFSSNALAEIAALKGQPSLLSLFANQNSIQPQQNQQMAPQNYNSMQNQLTDAQKQFLVRSLQSAQSSGQNQAGPNFIQSQMRAAGENNNNNQPIITVQRQPVPWQQSQPIVTTVGNPPPYITVQAQPLTTYLQNQSPQVPTQMDEQAMIQLMLSELNQPHGTDYNVYPCQVQKKNSKSNLKSLIPLIINLLKEKSSCGCNNCGCPNNGCGNNTVQQPVIPAIFGGYSNQKNYSQAPVATPVNTAIEEQKSINNVKEKYKREEEKSSKSEKKNAVKVVSEESEEENDSEYEDSEGD